MARSISDGLALDAIAKLLDHREWHSGDIETVAEYVRSTGREIREPLPEEERV